MNFFLAVLEFKLKVSHLVGRCSVTLPSLFYVGYFQHRVSRTVCQGWLWTSILLISATSVARIIVWSLVFLRQGLSVAQADFQLVFKDSGITGVHHQTQLNWFFKWIGLLFSHELPYVSVTTQWLSYNCQKLEAIRYPSVGWASITVTSGWHWKRNRAFL
jgi:hypothetical protein